MVGSASRFVPRTRFSTASFRGFSYFVMFKPPSFLVSRSFLPLQLSLHGSRDVYVRAEHASLPSHASDMLSARLQAIGGTRTLTSPDSQLCRLLTFRSLGFPGCFASRVMRPIVPGQLSGLA